MGDNDVFSALKDIHSQVAGLAEDITKGRELKVKRVIVGVADGIRSEDLELIAILSVQQMGVFYKVIAQVPLGNPIAETVRLLKRKVQSKLFRIIKQKEMTETTEANERLVRAEIEKIRKCIEATRKNKMNSEFKERR